jgi:hypothetical protein
MAGSSNPRWSTRTDLTPFPGPRRCGLRSRRDPGRACEQVVLEREQERRHAASGRVGGRQHELVGEGVGVRGAARVRGVRRAGVLPHQAEPEPARQRGGEPLRRPVGDVGALEQAVLVARAAAVLGRRAGPHGADVVEAGEVDVDPVGVVPGGPAAKIAG